MPTDVVMPRLSDSMQEGTILSWLKAVGEEIAVGDELVEIETDKANMVFEADTAGTLVEIVAEAGETVSLGAVIARIASVREPAAIGAENGPGGARRPVAATKAPALRDRQRASNGALTHGDSARVKASPLARRIARERGLDLGGLRGSGPGGRIVKRDVEEADPGTTAPPARSPLSAPAGRSPGERPSGRGRVAVQELSRIQKTVARRMAESKATVPHFHLQTEIDVTHAVAARRRWNQLRPARGDEALVPSINDMVVKACALALREHPRANGAYRDGGFELFSRVNVGMAIAAADALLVATIFDADRKGLTEIAREARGLAERARAGAITPPELSGATFSVSNLGMYGVSNFQPVVNPPQAAILAVGAIVTRPVVVEGELGTADLMAVTLACDHRILYGADAAGFLARIREILEEPLELAG
jgi:pyruvate dehydrogenase E2 component (dihydrolipoamide acetyltransferase)